MLCIVLGKSHKAKKIADKLAQNKGNIVFANSNCEFANKIDFQVDSLEEIKDFVIANEINLLILADEIYFNLGLKEELEACTDCMVISPDDIIAPLFLNNSTAKKFAYKNKILTPKFAVFEKETAAIDYLQTAEFPLIICPDKINELEPPRAFETKKKAKERIEFLFQTGNKKVLIENFTEGIIYTKYLLVDGTIAYNLFQTVSYFDEVSTNNEKYIKENSKLKIENEITPTILNAFIQEGFDYRGILGLKFVIDRKEDVYFERFLPFFSELDTNIAVEIIEDELEKILIDSTTGELNQKKTEINISPKYALTIDCKNEFITECKNTMSKAVDIIKYEADDKTIKLLDEAIKHWETY